MSETRPPLEGLRIHRTASPVRRVSLWLVTGLIAAVAVVAAVAWWLSRPQAIPVRLATAREVAAGRQATLLNATGYVTARREATVSSKITGKILEVLIEEGSRVAAGDVLARLDASNIEANLRLAQAQLEAARHALTETEANLALAELQLRRQTELSQSQTISASDLDRAEADARAWRGRHARGIAEVTVAARQVDVWAQQLEDTFIRAPFAGVVTSKNAQPGEMISPMSSGGFTRTGVCTLVDMESLEIEVDVNESYITRVKPGQPVEAMLDAYADWRIPAEVIAIIPSADRQKATVRVRVGFAALDPRILPDMGVKVAFQSSEIEAADQRPRIVVPRTALRQRDGRDVVWVAADGRVSRRAVAVAAADGDNVILTAGLAAGERVVTEGPTDLEEGARIEETTS